PRQGDQNGKKYDVKADFYNGFKTVRQTGIKHFKIQQLYIVLFFIRKIRKFFPSLQIKSAEEQAEESGNTDQDQQCGDHKFFSVKCFPYNEIHNKDRACIIAEGKQV